MKRKRWWSRKKIGERLRERGMFSVESISLVLNSYDDIFSSFDPRPYEGKAMSDDFLLECKRAAREKDETKEIRLLLPKEKRNLGDEAKIKKRLKNHFQKHYEEKLGEKKKVVSGGITLIVIGAILLLAATLLYKKEGFMFILLLVIFEPAGWFTIWTGLERVFIVPEEKVPDLEFYKKMAKVKVNFYSY